MTEIFLVDEDMNCNFVKWYAKMRNLAVTFENGDQLEPKNPMIPFREFPMIIDDDVTVFGVCNIISYLAEMEGDNECYSKDVKIKAQLNSILYWINSTLYRSVMDNYVLPQTKPEDKLPDNNTEYLLRFGVESIKELLNELESVYFSQGNHIFGNKVTILDYYAAFILLELEKIKFEFTSWPKTKKWLDSTKQKIQPYL